MKNTVANNIVNILKERIITAVYQPGEKLPSEIELCKNLGVSRSSLREGLRSLEVAGYVELKPGKGSFVADTLPDVNASAREWLSRREFDLKDLLEARRAIEPVCAQLAARNITIDDATYLFGLLYRFEAAFKSDDVDGMVAEDEKLHIKIAELSKNNVLITFMSILNEKLHEYRVHLFSVAGNGANAIPLHKAIVEKITSKDSMGASEEMSAHVNDIFRNLNDITH